jgi:hypothetical protein
MLRRSPQPQKAALPILFARSIPSREATPAPPERVAAELRDGRAREKEEAGEAPAARERRVLDLRDPAGDGHVGDVRVASPLPHHFSFVGGVGGRGGARAQDGGSERGKGGATKERLFDVSKGRR